MSVKNNFPRVHSISTVGVIYHFNADYPFHRFRTDFTGEGGSGKTMVADMIQLILLGPANYLSATEGNDKRPIEGMVMPPKNRQYGAGYVVMNVEVSPARYLALGCFIEKSSKQTKMFIAQAGFDWESRLEPLSSPVYHKDFLVEETIVSVEELNKVVHHIHLKPLNLKNYHRLLFENGILAFDLSNKKKLDSFASIFRSFSRGKALKKDSENLKDFLFGDAEKALMENYQQQVKSIADDYHEHDRYQKEIELIGKKQGFIKEIVTLEEQSKALEKAYREEKILFWNNQVKSISIRHNTNQLDYHRSSLELAAINLHHAELFTNELQENTHLYRVSKEKIENLKESQENYEAKKEDHYSTLSDIKGRLEKAKGMADLLKAHGEEAVLRDRVKAEKQFMRDKSLLGDFILYLRSNRIEESFESSVWNTDYESAVGKSVELEKSLTARIQELDALTVFSDIDSPDSLAGWAIHSLGRELSLQEESLLRYFQKLPREKPEVIEKLSRYLPDPDILFDGPDVRDLEINKGFWINLGGVIEHIPYVEKQYLNKDRKTVLELLSGLKQGLDMELAECRRNLQELVQLKGRLTDFEQLKSALHLYNSKESFEREIDLLLIIDDQSLESQLGDLAIQGDLEKQRLNVQTNLDELIQLQHFNDSTSVQRDFDQALKFFKDNQLEVTKLDSHLEDWKEKKTIYEQELFKLQEEFSKDLLEVQLIQKALLREATSTTSALRIQLEKERKFDIDKKAFEGSDKDLNTSQDKLKNAHEEFLLAFRKRYEVGVNTDIVQSDPDLGEYGTQSKYNKAKLRFETKYNVIVQELEDGTAIQDSYHVGQLAHKLLPTVFTSAKAIETTSVEILLSEKLESLQQAVKEIGSRKIQILKRVFTDVNAAYRDYMLKVTEINQYFNSPSKIITGGSRASLILTPSVDYPAKWMSVFSRSLSNETGTLDLFETLSNEIDINEMMKTAFIAEGGKRDVRIEDLLNPKSYFDLEFKLKLESGENNSGSNSQAYSGYALLGLARLSLLAEPKRNGIKIMPIDEAQGLGSNYEMLRKVALEEGYQILSMSIDSAGDLHPGEQYIYMLSENKLHDDEHYVPAMGIFTEGVVTANISEFINENRNQDS